MISNIIVGTAGHIDHGKTALIKALTGYDADRLKEEKERGITIELGFTHFDMPDGRRVGIVDVPGHEKFIRTMVSGATGMDLVLVVIAADEGIMPQTREHLDIINLLGIQKILIVLTKCDLVDEDQVTEVKWEVEEYLKDTPWPDAQMAVVSSKTGEGLDEFVEKLMELTKSLKARPVDTIFRLPIDRVFSLPGQGTIVTGTLISGKIGIRDDAQLYPGGTLVKVRNIQVHDEDVEYAYAGQRVALNLAGVSKSDVQRGDVVGTVNAMQSSDLLDARVYMLKTTERKLENNMRAHIDIGTTHVPCRVFMLEKDLLEKGDKGLVQLRLEKPLAVCFNDRFVLRFFSPTETIGGGCVLDPHPVRKKKKGRTDIEGLRRLENGGLAGVVENAVLQHGHAPISFDDLVRECGATAEELRAVLDTPELKNVIQQIPAKQDVYFYHMDCSSKMLSELQQYLESFHAENPYKPGEKQSTLYHKLFSGFTKDVYQSLLEIWNKENVIWTQTEIVSKANFRMNKDERYTRIANLIVHSLQKAGTAFIKLGSIQFLPEDERWVDDVMECLLQKKTIIRLDQDYYTLNSIYKKLLFVVEEQLSLNGKVTIAEIRDLTDTSRKNVKLLFVYLDKAHITKGNGTESERIPYQTIC